MGGSGGGDGKQPSADNPTDTANLGGGRAVTGKLKMGKKLNSTDACEGVSGACEGVQDPSI